MLRWLVSEIIAAAVWEGSATLAAVTATLAGVGRIAGAVKLPSAAIVPQAAPAQPGPVRDHATEFAGWPALAMVAPNDCTAPSSTLAAAGATCTRTSLITATTALALLPGAA
jgi:hypothetical protein